MMNRSILWNGFEIKKGLITTSVGEVPYMIYSPEMSRQPVTVAIHKETGSKEEWLCFNSTSKPGNLLKESIRNNSTFIAFDLYGHGEWQIEDRSFNPGNFTKEEREIFIKKSKTGIEEALETLLKVENIENNPLTLVGNSLGCSVVLNIELESLKFSSVLLSPFDTEVSTTSRNFMIHRGENDTYIDSSNFDHLIKKLPKEPHIIRYSSGHEIDESWINSTKEFIYLRSHVG